MRALLLGALCLITLHTHCVAQSNPNPQTTTTITQTPSLAQTTDASGVRFGWSVLPYDVVRDNYGQYVAKRYFALSVVIVNNTNNQLIIKAFEFPGKVPGNPEITMDPSDVRGSIVKGQTIGRRNRIVQGLRTIGLIATGAGGFFKAAGSAATYGRAVTIFSDPFTTGIELIFPDTTIRYLREFSENEVFSRGFVVGSGGVLQGKVFVPIEAFYLKESSEYQSARKGRYDPSKIKTVIRQLAFIGDTVITVDQAKRFTAQ